MKKLSCSILIGLALGLASSNTSYGMSQLASIALEPEWPATTSPGNVILYKVSAVCRAGQGLLDVSLTASGLPAGAVVTFSPASLRFTGNAPTAMAALVTINCADLTATDNYPFVVTATAQREFKTFGNVVQQKLYGPISKPLALVGLDRLPNGSFKLRRIGSTGQTYQIECTADLTNPVWTPVGSTTADGNGRFSFFPAYEPPMRFFRAVWTPGS